MGVATLELLRTRLELASLEFAEERERAKIRFTLILVAALSGTLALLCLSAFVVLYFWDSHRLAAMAVVTLVYIALTLFAALRLRASLHAPHIAFAQTLAELERDREWLAATMHEPPSSRVDR